MSSITQRLDQALQRLQGEGLTPVTIVLAEPDHEELAGVSDWPVTVSTRSELRFRLIPVYKGRAAEPGSIVGRNVSGATTRLPLQA